MMVGFHQVTEHLVNIRNTGGKEVISTNTNAHFLHILSKWLIWFKNRNDK